MITSYILDHESLQDDFDLDKLQNLSRDVDSDRRRKKAALQQQANIRHFSHWVRGLLANGILYTQKGWKDAIVKALDHFPSDRHSEIADFIKELQEGVVTFSAGANQMTADCLIGKELPMMAQAVEKTSLVQYFSSKTEMQRERDLGMHSFSKKNQRIPDFQGHLSQPYYFEERIKRFTRHTDEIHLIDRIWGNNIDNLDTSRRFARSMAKLIKLITTENMSDETIEVKIYTEQWRWKPDRSTAKLYLKNQCRRAIEVLERRRDEGRNDERCSINERFVEHLREYEATITPDLFGKLNFDLPTRMAAEADMRDALQHAHVDPNRITWSLSVREVGHDRYLATNSHVLSFGAGFDIYQPESDSIREFNVYYVGNRKSFAQHVSLLAPKSNADELEKMSCGE